MAILLLFFFLLLNSFHNKIKFHISIKCDSQRHGWFEYNNSLKRKDELIS